MKRLSAIVLSTALVLGAALTTELARASESAANCPAVSKELQVAIGGGADIINALTYKPTSWKQQLKRGRDSARAASAAIQQATSNPTIIAEIRKFAREARKKRPVAISLMRPLSEIENQVKKGKC